MTKAALIMLWTVCKISAISHHPFTNNYQHPLSYVHMVLFLFSFRFIFLIFLLFVCYLVKFLMINSVISCNILKTSFNNQYNLAVNSIRKQHLVEVRSMANPPANVKLALESICLLLGENATDWKAIRAVIMRENFIHSIVTNFNTEEIS